MLNIVLPARKPKPTNHLLRILLVLSLASLIGCASGPKAPPPPESTGAAGGAAAVGADANLQTCAGTVGTVRLQDGQESADTRANQVASNETIQSIRLLLKDIKDITPKDKNSTEGVSIEALRLLIQQSGCFVIVDRGVSESASSDEKRRARAPDSEVRDGSNMGKGQEVAADFVLRAVVLGVSSDESSKVNVGGFLPFRALGGVSVGQTVTSAKVQLVLSDVRAKIQLAVAQGSSSSRNTGLATRLLGGVGGGLLGGSASTSSATPAAAVLLQAYADAYNKLVPAVQNYKSQEVKGGLGTGGTLKVQGSRTDASTAAQ